MMWMRNISVSSVSADGEAWLFNAAAIDTRIKATVTSTMYDMSRVNANGYFDAMDTTHVMNCASNSMNSVPLTQSTAHMSSCGRLTRYVTRRCAPILKDYYAYYKTKRGYHKRSLNSNGGWNKTSALSSSICLYLV